MFVAPQVDGGAAGPNYATAVLDTVRGTVSVTWSKQNDTLWVKAGIAIGVSSATVTVPAKDVSTVVIKDDGQGSLVRSATVWEKGAFVPGQKGVISAVVAADGSGVTFNVTSGIFNFAATPA